jgi:hypothetical protein
MQVANGLLIWKCGRGVTGELNLQTLTSCALRWQKFNWWVLNILLFIFIIISVVTFKIYLQEKYKEEVVKQHGEGFNWEDEPINGRSVNANGGRKAHGRWDWCSVLFNFVNARYDTSYYCWLLFLKVCSVRWGAGLQEAIPPRGSSSSQPSGLTPRVSQIHLNYEAMKNQLRTTQDALAAEQEDHRETRESLNAFHAQIQAFMVVRNKNTFIAFITFSDIYVC